MSDSSVLSNEPGNSSKRKPEAYGKVSALALFWEAVKRGTTDDEIKHILDYGGDSHRGNYEDFVKTERLHDGNRKSEIASFKTLFTERDAMRTYSYVPLEIPLDIPKDDKLLRTISHQDWVAQKVKDFLATNDTPDTLIVFYYSGHAGRTKQYGKYSQLLLAPEQRTPCAELCFTTIQNQFLEQRNTDLLMIMDCCEGAATPLNAPFLPPEKQPSDLPLQIERFWQLINRRVDQKTEILAAAGKEGKAMGPGELSFTTSMMTVIDTISKSRDFREGIRTCDLHRRVLLGEGSEEGHLPATPILIGLNPDKNNAHISLPFANDEDARKSSRKPRFEPQAGADPKGTALTDRFRRGLDQLVVATRRFSRIFSCR